MKKNYIRIIGIVLVTAAVTAAVTLLFLQQHIFSVFGGEEGYKQALSYVQAQQAIEEEFVGEYDPAALREAAMDGMIAALDDQWSYYMTAEEYAAYLQNGNNEYSGIGVVIQAAETGEGLLITEVYPDSPAEAAGIQPGQLLLAIDGVAVQDTEAAGTLIREKQGQELCLRIRQADGTEQELRLTGAAVYKKPVSYTLLENDIGYIRLANFEYTVNDAFRAAVEALQAQGARALIFDVRFNPGGKVSELTAMLDYLLPEGTVFISRDKDGEETVYGSDAACVELPMAVLVNGYSYSAAEFFAAALQERGAAVVVGEPTTGKGRSQSNYQLADGGVLHISTKSYYTAAGVNLAETGGIIPDVQLALEAEAAAKLYQNQLAYDEDAQILAAVQALLQEKGPQA